MRVWEELKRGAEYLSQAGIEHYQLESEILLSHVLQMPREKLYIHDELEIKCEDYARWASVLNERKRKKPIAYILGKKEFMSMDFLVDENVLIPRPETELIVEKVLSITNGKKDYQWQIVDLGTGSGNLAVSLAYYLLNGKIWATDVSEKALGIAKINAERNNVGNRIEFLCGSWFVPLESSGLGGKMDFVLSNPPYLTREEMCTLPKDVEYEPELALDGGNDGLKFYGGIINDSLRFLKKGGALFLEIGARQKNGVVDLINKSGGFYDTKITKDYSGFDRIIVARANG